MNELQSGSDVPGDPVRIWRSEALALGARSETPDPVWHFLESKGVSRREASEAAIRIWQEAQGARAKADRLRRSIGWSLIAIGAMIGPFALLGGAFVTIVALMPMGFGTMILLSEHLGPKDG